MCLDTNPVENGGIEAAPAYFSPSSALECSSLNQPAGHFLLRFSRRVAIMERLPYNPQVTRPNALPSLVQKSVSITDELLALCNYQTDDDSSLSRTLSMRGFPHRVISIARIVDRQFNTVISVSVNSSAIYRQFDYVSRKD